MNDRLMMSEEKCIKRVKELLQISKEDLLIKFMFQEQETERLNNIINGIENYIDEDEWTSVNGVITAKLIKNKLKELKKSTNNENN